MGCGHCCRAVCGGAVVMITLADYLGPWKDHADATPEVRANAEELLRRVNALLNELIAAGIAARTNPKTGTAISGETGGGFRPQDYPVGAPKSAHKTGQALDLFDPFGSVGGYLYVRQSLLVKHRLWMEAPAACPGWCHLQSRPVPSGRTVFNP